MVLLERETPEHQQKTFINMVRKNFQAFIVEKKLHVTLEFGGASGRSKFGMRIASRFLSQYVLNDVHQTLIKPAKELLSTV